MIHVRLFTSAIHSGNDQWTVIVMFCFIYNRITTVALCITTAKDLTDFTALRFHQSCSYNDSTIILIPYSIFLHQVATISTAKRSTDIKRAIDNDLRTWHNGRVTTTIHFLYTCYITLANINRGSFS